MRKSDIASYVLAGVVTMVTAPLLVREIAGLVDRIPEKEKHSPLRDLEEDD